MMCYLQDIGILQCILAFLSILLCFVVYVYNKKQKFNLLPGPKGLPILGILPFLGKNPHLELTKLGRKYGGIFGAWFGKTYVVVVTDVEIAKQLLTKNATADRPPFLSQFIPDGVGLASNNGPEWMEQRRYTMMEMKRLGFGKSNWEKLVQMEVSDFLEVLANSQGEPIEINKPLFTGISNTILSLVTNHRLSMGHPRRDAIDRGVESFMVVHSQGGVMLYFPRIFQFLVSLGLLRIERKLKDLINMNKCIRQEIEELKNKGSDSYIDRYLKEVEKNEQMDLRNTFNETNLVGNVQALIIGGSDTTYTSLLWLLFAMASFSEIQSKVHKELDNVLGNDGSIDWVDRHKLPYCMAVILEGQRWRTLVPLNLMHRTNEDLVINGYDIPNGTNLLPLLWAFHNDTKNWENPDMFQPERFLSTDEKSVKEHEALLPFSYGKRICPGKTVAYIELFHFFVSIMQRFQVLPETDKLPDLEGIFGLTLEPKKQLLRFISR